MSGRAQEFWEHHVPKVSVALVRALASRCVSANRALAGAGIDNPPPIP